MANIPFEYRIINPLERPKSEDLNIAQGQAHSDTRLLAAELFGLQSGFLGDGFSVGVSPVDPTQFVSTTGGVFFQNTDVEDINIGGIPGLNDTYPYKATTIGDLDILVPPPPTLVNEKRYDLIQVRSMTGAERLIDPVATDILDPALQRFNDLTKYKTLTSSFSPGILAGLLPGYTDIDVPVTAPMSYVTGAVATTADWGDVVKPGIVPGYMGVVYIKRYYGQTTIAAGDIEDARTLLTVSTLTGGTGSSDAAAYTGSVAWFDTAESKIKYTQAVDTDGPIFGARTGWLLASNSSGAPTWIEPGTYGQALVSTGSAWAAADLFSYYSTLNEIYTSSINSDTYVAIPELSLTNIALRRGNARIELSPNASHEAGLFWTVATPLTNVAFIKVVVTRPDATTSDYVFRYQAGNNQDYPITLPSMTAFLSQAGNYSVAVFAQTAAVGSTFTFRNCDLVVSQG